ncbi:MAG: hypothetical protein PHS14_01955 [Elusimicrobia bacterium]|nr:hypothetical protein [Elusimicrobiota bacterium]
MKNYFSIAAAVVLASLLAPRASFAAEDGQLWEVTSKMDMPDMPAGMMGAMGGRTTQVCRGEDEREAVTKNKEMKECETSDFKQTATTVSMSFKCKENRSGKMEFTYNKAHTEYKGTMHMKDGKHGEMTMRLTGKKLGPCDAKKARAETAAKIDKIKSQGADAQVQYEAMKTKSERDQIKACDKALDKMNPEGFSFYGSCYHKKDASCKSMMDSYIKQQPKAAAECSAKADAFCAQYQTEAGFQKIGRDGSRLDSAERMCGVKADDLRKKLCKGASKNESYEFVGAHCPDEAKPLAKKHCAGRSYTVKEGDPRRVEKKWFKFCKAVAGAGLEGDEDAEKTEKPAPAPKSVKDGAKDAAKSEAKKAAKGAAVDALKGLFGR